MCNLFVWARARAHWTAKFHRRCPTAVETCLCISRRCRLVGRRATASTAQPRQIAACLATVRAQPCAGAAVAQFLSICKRNTAFLSASCYLLQARGALDIAAACASIGVASTADVASSVRRFACGAFWGRTNVLAGLRRSFVASRPVTLPAGSTATDVVAR